MSQKFPPRTELAWREGTRQPHVYTSPQMGIQYHEYLSKPEHDFLVRKAVEDATVLAWQKALEFHRICEQNEHGGEMSFDEFCFHMIGIATMDVSQLGKNT